MADPAPVEQGSRLVILGKNSSIWRHLREMDGLPANIVAIGHSEIPSFQFKSTDIVWIFSYSKNLADNRALIEGLAAKQAGSFVYVSSATANIAQEITCYAYPRAKAASEAMARTILQAQVTRLGVVVADTNEAPNGTVAITRFHDLALAINGSLHQGAHSVPEEFFTLEHKPFASALEQRVYRIYGWLMLNSSSPCFLRPLDVLLRMAGWRWYGYLYLSNHKWSSMT